MLYYRFVGVVALVAAVAFTLWIGGHLLAGRPLEAKGGGPLPVVAVTIFLYVVGYAFFRGRLPGSRHMRK